MPIRTEKHITRAMLRENPTWLFLFGDNLQRKGLGGQAAEMRGEPNAVGIPTKRRPSRDPDAYLTDTDVRDVVGACAWPFNQLGLHLQDGGTVVIPERGIGTGLADLPNRAPRVWRYLALRFTILRMIAEGRALPKVEAMSAMLDNPEPQTPFIDAWGAPLPSLAEA